MEGFFFLLFFLISVSYSVPSYRCEFLFVCLVGFFFVFFLLESLSDDFASVERLLDAHVIAYNESVSTQLKEKLAADLDRHHLQQVRRERLTNWKRGKEQKQKHKR